MITIQSKVGGFRRAGVVHPAEPTEYPDNHFSKKQLKMLKKEPMLIITKTVDKPKQNPPPAAEMVDIVEAIATLDKENKKLWTKSGAPQTTALEAAIKDKKGSAVTVSADSRNAAWEEFNKNNPSGE